MAGIGQLLALGIWLIAGCTIDISAVVNPDGTGTVSAAMIESVEKTDWLRQVPNMDAHLEVWKADLRANGIMVDDIRLGDTERVFLQSRFSSLEALGSTRTLPGGVSTWVYASAEEAPSETIYRYSAVLDTTSLYRASPDLQPAVLERIREQLRSMKITYSLTLPGELLYSNADRRHGNRVIWDIRMDEKNQIRAESRVIHPAESSQPLHRVWLTLGVLAALFVVTILLTLAAYRRRRG